MIRLAVVGDIGSGKSHIAKQFGYPVFNADLEVSKLYKKNSNIPGFLLGVFFLGIFGIRFIVEFVKESQGGFESDFPLFSTGQWLSIPLIISGIILILVSYFKSIKNKV